MEWLENYLKAYRGAVLVVSHDRYFLDAVCTRIWELRGKSIKTYRGNYSAYLPQREAADERQQKLHDAAVEKAAKLQDYVDRNWSVPPPPRWPRAVASSWRNWRSSRHPPPRRGN